MRNSGNCIYDYAQSFFGEEIISYYISYIIYYNNNISQQILYFYYNIILLLILFIYYSATVPRQRLHRDAGAGTFIFAFGSQAARV